MSRGLSLGQSLQVTEHEWFAIFSRQVIDRAVQHRAQVAPDRVLRRGRRHLVEVCIGGPPPQRRRFRLQRRAVRDAVEPVAEQFRLTQRPRLADEQEKCGLKGVLGIVAVAQDAPAHAEDHRPVALQQRGKRRLVAALDELLQQTDVGCLAAGATEVVKDGSQLSHGHVVGPPDPQFLPINRLPATGSFFSFFRRGRVVRRGG